MHGTLIGYHYFKFPLYDSNTQVNPGEDENKERAKNAMTKGAESTNEYGNRLWYVAIPKFYPSGNSQT